MFVARGFIVVLFPYTRDFASLYPGVRIGTGDILLGSSSSQAILLVASCRRNRIKHRPCGPLASSSFNTI